MSNHTCMQCGTANMRSIASYDEFIAASKDATHERKIALDYLTARPEATFREFLACTSCGVIRIDPQPTPQMLGDFYQNYYGSSDYSRKQDKKIARALKRLKSIRRHVKGGQFLDVGCNVGFAVEAARRAGFNATGIEIDSKAVDYAKINFPGNEFFATTIEQFGSTHTYDLVYCTEVIEHVTDPVAFAKHLARLTAPGGHLFLTTPDAGHWRVPKPFVSWAEVKPLEHINWQTRKSLSKLLMDAGFERPRVSFNLKPNLRILARRRTAA